MREVQSSTSHPLVPRPRTSEALGFPHPQVHGRRQADRAVHAQSQHAVTYITTIASITTHTETTTTTATTTATTSKSTA